MNRFYVYVYLDPRRPGKYNFPGFSFDFKPIYVGKGSKNRDINHLNYCKKTDSHFYRILRRILNENDKPKIIRIKEDLTEEEAFKLEIELIRIIGRTDLKTGTLLNKTSGGDGITITKEKRSQTSLNNWKRKEYRKFFLDLNSDDWKIIFPDETCLIIKNLNEWCQQNNFNYNSCKTYSKRKTKYHNICFINLNKQGNLTSKDFREASTHKNKKRRISIYEIQFKDKKEFQVTGLSTLYKLFNFSITHLQNSIINNTYAYDSFKIKKISESIQYIEELTDFQKSLFLNISKDKLKNLRKKRNKNITQ